MDSTGELDVPFPTLALRLAIPTEGSRRVQFEALEAMMNAPIIRTTTLPLPPLPLLCLLLQLQELSVTRQMVTLLVQVV